MRTTTRATTPRTLTPRTTNSAPRGTSTPSLRDPESEPFLLRRHHVTAQTGFAGAAERAERNARERERQELIHAKLKEDRENS